MSSYKQAIIISEDLEMSTGKKIAQACHASLKSAKDASDDTVEKWERLGSKKVTLSSGEKSLEELYNQAKRNKLPAYLVKDAGLTEVETGAKTALGIGPAEASKIDKITGELSLIE